MAKQDQDKAERLAAALRENLRKRKTQARAAEAASVPAQAGTQSRTQKKDPTQPASE
jgi:hypothetical protein